MTAVWLTVWTAGVFSIAFVLGAHFHAIFTDRKRADDLMAVADVVQSDTPVYDAVAAELDAILTDAERGTG